MLQIDTSSSINRTILDLESLGISEIPAIGKYSYTKPFRKLHPEIFCDLKLMIYMEKGEQEYFVDGIRYTLKSGHVLLINPLEMHTTGKFFENRGKLFWILLRTRLHGRDAYLGTDADIGNNIVNTIVLSREKILSISNSFVTKLKEIFKIYSLLNEDKKYYIEKLKHCLFLLISEIYEYIRFSAIPQATNYKDKRILNALEYIQAHIYEEIDLNYLSLRIAFMSLPHFIRVFKQTLGYTPRDFINFSRIDKAKELIKQRKNMTMIARDLGFSSSQYFATVFSKYTGVTPTEFKKKILVQDSYK